MCINARKILNDLTVEENSINEVRHAMEYRVVRRVVGCVARERNERLNENLCLFSAKMQSPRARTYRAESDKSTRAKEMTRPSLPCGNKIKR